MSEQENNPQSDYGETILRWRVCVGAHPHVHPQLSDTFKAILH